MTTKEYLQQPYQLDKAINAKLAHYEQIQSMLTKITTTLTGMPSGGSTSDKIGDGVSKLVDLSNDINKDVDRYADIKRDVTSTIQKIGNAELRAVLEYRHLAFKSWEQIAVNMNYSYRTVLYIHSRALQAVDNFAHHCT
ncbi:MAG: hypothetical protein AB9835_14480 [Eubacteriales bacterium]